jgi:hypothetical protein
MEHVMMMEIPIDVNVRIILWVIDVKEVMQMIFKRNDFIQIIFQRKKVVHHLNVLMEEFVSILLYHLNVFVQLIMKDNDVI